MKRRIASALAIVLLVSTISYGSKPATFATTSDELQDEQDEIESEIAELREELGDLDSTLGKVSDEVVSLQKDIGDVEESIELLNKQLVLAQEKADQQYEYMKLRLQYMYENSSTYSLLYLLEAETFTELNNRYEYVSAVSKRDRQMMDAYEATIKEIANCKAELEQKNTELASKQQALEKKQEDLLASISDVNKDITKKQEISDELAEQIKKMEEIEREIERQRIEQLIKEDEERRKQEAANNPGAVEGDEENPGAVIPEAPLVITPAPGGGMFVGNDPTIVAGFEYHNVGAISISPGEEELLAALIWCEAGSNSYALMQAVGSVVVNQVLSPYYPNTITGVIYKKNAYTPARSGRLALALQNGLASDACRMAAREVLSGNLSGRWTAFWVYTAGLPRMEGFIIDGCVFRLKY